MTECGRTSLGKATPACFLHLENENLYQPASISIHLISFSDFITFQTLYSLQSTLLRPELIPAIIVFLYINKLTWNVSVLLYNSILLYSGYCLKQILICFICIEGIDVHRCCCAPHGILFNSVIGRALGLIKINYNHSDVIMKMAPYSLFDFLNIIISHLSFLCNFLKCSSYQSLSNTLQIFSNLKMNIKMLWRSL